MFFRTMITCALLSVWPPCEASAFTVEEAQICADKILGAYNQKTYPRTLLAIEAIVATAFGGQNRGLTPGEARLALEVGEAHIRESFTAPTGKYHYENLVVATVEKAKSGYRVLGEVTVLSPRANGRYSFLALVTKDGCKVHQVRIADFMTLIDELKTTLANDPRVKGIFRN